MGRRSPDSPDVAEYNGKMEKYRDSRHRSPRSPSMEKQRRYDRSCSPAPIKRRARRSYESPDRRRGGRKHVRTWSWSWNYFYLSPVFYSIATRESTTLQMRGNIRHEYLHP